MDVESTRPTVCLSPAPATIGRRHPDHDRRGSALDLASRLAGLDQLLELARKLGSQILEPPAGRLGKRSEHRGDPFVARLEVGVDLVVALDPLDDLLQRELAGSPWWWVRLSAIGRGRSSVRSWAWPSLMRSLNASSVAWVIVSASLPLSNDARLSTRS